MNKSSNPWGFKTPNGSYLHPGNDTGKIRAKQEPLEKAEENSTGIDGHVLGSCMLAAGLSTNWPPAQIQSRAVTSGERDLDSFRKMSMESSRKL